MKNIKLSKFTYFPVQMWVSSIIHALSWIFMKKYQTFKVYLFPSSDVRFKYYSCAFINFDEKISNFQSSLISQFRCEIYVLVMRFHKFSWKKIKLSNFILFPNFNEKISNFQSLLISHSDVRFKYYSCAFINFDEKISNFQSSLISQFRCEI